MEYQPPVTKQATQDKQIHTKQNKNIIKLKPHEINLSHVSNQNAGHKHKTQTH